MWVSDEMQMVYLASPKTASKATKEALRPLGFEKRAGHHTVMPHPGPGWTVFTTVRNHWDAWVSWFFFAGPRGLPFGQSWIERWLANQRGYYPWPQEMYGLYTREADRVLRYEHLQEDLNDLFQREVPLPVVNEGVLRKHRPYQPFYDEQTRLWVGQNFSEEIERYGYTFEEDSCSYE